MFDIFELIEGQWYFILTMNGAYVANGFAMGYSYRGKSVKIEYSATSNISYYNNGKKVDFIPDNEEPAFPIADIR